MILVESHDFPIVSMQLHFGLGSFIDPPGKEGLTYLTSQMLVRGSQTRNQAKYAEAVEMLGGSVSVITGREFITVSAGSLSRNLAEMCALVAEAITQPSFDEAELSKLKRLVISAIQERRDNDEALAQHLFYQALYQPGAYARPIKGTAESLERITREDIVACYQRVFTRAALLIGAAGDVDEPTFESVLAPMLEALPQGETPELPLIESRDPGTIKVVLVDKPNRTQTQIFGGHQCLAAAHPDRLPLLVGNTAYGGTFTARLSHEIREKRGWSYGAYSYVIARRSHGSFLFRFYPAMKDTVAALALGLELNQQLVDDGLTDDEVHFASRYLANHFPFRIETPRKRLQELVRLRMLKLAPDYLETYVSKIQEITPSQVNSALRTHIKPKDLTIVMVCTAEPLVDEIRALPGVGEVVIHPYDKNWPHSESAIV